MAAVHATPENIAAAAELIRAGRLVAFPTETVYGLGADATSGQAVARIFAAKGRPSFNPLIVHVAAPADAERLGRFTPLARTLAAAFWPGPLTLVVARSAASPIADLATAGLATLALRCPAHAIARALIAASGRPLAAPSANRSGHVSATRAGHVAADLADAVAMILDDGPSPGGIESTVLDVTRAVPVLLRPGGVTREAIEAVVGGRVASAPTAYSEAGDPAPASPGLLASHYAPRAAVRFAAAAIPPEDAVLAFGPPPPGLAAAHVFNLSPAGDLVEAAANLFAGLRALDATGARVITVLPVPAHGLGEAINDRLRRAATPRHHPDAATTLTHQPKPTISRP
jgi:L-threonylcarbamoyladenylate synthase